VKAQRAVVSPDWEYIDDQRAFAELVERLADAPEYAVDTEFHRERTYYPHVALVQIADEHGVSLVDALAVDLAPLSKVLEGDGLAVMHAARQDLEVLERACGTIPTRLVDTQLAAGFLGYTSPSLAVLLERELKVSTGKADRLTDWMRRPLTQRQLSYAADDVAHLLELHRRLWDKLATRERTAWAQEACEELCAEPRGTRAPDEAWRRIKEVRHLKGSRLAVAQAVAAWRERRAAEADLTPRFVLSDLGVVSIASSAPSTIEELRHLRGVDGRALKGRTGEDLLSAVEQSRDSRPAPRDPGTTVELDAELRPVVPLISAWVSQRARELDLETSLLATRSDLEQLLRGDPSARLAHGWRAEIVGEPIGSLVEGRKALVFRRGSGLELVDLSG
jgi:ribonuclease D